MDTYPEWDATQPHPIHGPVEELPRHPDGSIPLYYYLSPEEIVLTGTTPPPDRKLLEREFSPDAQTRFIETLAESGTVSAACQAAGISRMTAYRYRNRPGADAFRAAWDAASRTAVRLLADTAMERAIEGVEEPIFHKGEQIGTRRRYNDRLLMFLLRARDPANYAPLSELGTWNQIRGIEPTPALDTALTRLEGGESAPPPAPLIRVTSVTPPPADAPPA